jgi:hypothetical protein
MQIKLVSESELLPGQAQAHQIIYALHKAPLRDRQSQLGMMNVPIILPPSLASERIKASPVSASALPAHQDLLMGDSRPAALRLESSSAIKAAEPNTIAQSTCAGKRMKMIKVTRTFTENGYQMTETVNEMVPCDDDDSEALISDLTATATGRTSANGKTTAPSAAAPPKQSNLMSFFKKAKQ